MILQRPVDGEAETRRGDRRLLGLRIDGETFETLSFDAASLDSEGMTGDDPRIVQWLATWAGDGR